METVQSARKQHVRHVGCVMGQKSDWFMAHQSVLIDECMMGNQGNMERNSNVCVEVQNKEKY